MKQMLAVLLYTFREALRRKVFLAFTIIILLSLLVLFFAAKAITFPAADAALPPGQTYKEITELIVFRFETTVVLMVAQIGMLLSIFAGASLLTDLYQRGTVDLFLAKPVSRVQFLLGRLAGGMLVVFSNLSLLVFGIWLVIGLQMNFWNPRILFAAVNISYAFLVLYSFIALIGVSSRSVILGAIMGFFVYLFIGPIVGMREQIYLVLKGGWVKPVAETLAVILPQSNEIISATTEFIVKGAISNLRPFYLGFLLLFANIGVTLVIFEKKDL